jgi:hypothetical protein
VIVYRADQEVLGRKGNAVLAEGADHGARIAHLEHLDILELPGTDAPYTAVIRAGKAELRVEVTSVAAEDVSASLLVGEAGKLDGQVVTMRIDLRDREGEQVLAGAPTWSPAELGWAAGDWFGYYLTAAGPTRELRGTVGSLTASAMIHAAPI